MFTNELEVLKFWDDELIFEKSLQNRKKNNKFTFLDGPPFANGTPHWGHIMQSYLKDTVLRYKTQQGFYVPRRWGWDTHGVPVEKSIEKKLKIKDRREIEERIGIAEFNKACRESIFEYDSLWRAIIHRAGRWVDMDDQYRTLDNEFAESVWWGLSQLWNKNLIYKSYRTVLYSTSLGTPLSHTDIAMEIQYRDETIDTPVVRFEVTAESWNTLKSTIIEQIEEQVIEQKEEHTNAKKELNNISKTSKKFGFSLSKRQKNTELPGIIENSIEFQKAKEKIEILEANITTLTQIRTTLLGNAKLSILAWTTTPWTLPSNSALAVGADIDYSIFYLPSSEEFILVAEKRSVPIISLHFKDEVINNPQLEEKLKTINDSAEYFKELNLDIIKIVTLRGEDLTGLEYSPPFEPTQKIKEYEKKSALFKVYTAEFVTDEDGTGIIHIAPYGEDDYALITKHNMPFLLSLNEYGEMLNTLHPKLTPVFGKSYEAANPLIIQILEKEYALFGTIRYKHRVPYFDRDGKKLIYFPIENWFIAETEFKHRSLELNKKTNWFPENFRDGRFGQGLETAPDWSISRNRYWGNPLPIWHNKELNKYIFIDSLATLVKKAVNPFYTIINSRNLNPEHYANRRTVIFGDSKSKLPLGINASQYRSKHLFELRQQKNTNIADFAPYAQKMLDEILELFTKYHTVQMMLDDTEQRLWTTWLYNLHPNSKKTTSTFYFYRKVEKNSDVYEAVGPITMFDIHRPFIDDIVLKDEVNNYYYRIPDVLDCWVESGSMPWASWHYPYENKELVESSIPADWIVEAQEQTRGWFRTLHVLSTAIWDKPAFANVNSTGIILASDGAKMSKSKQNYSDPATLLEKYGSDAVRLYIGQSPVVNAETLRFVESDLDRVFRSSTLLTRNIGQYVTMIVQQYKRITAKPNFKHPLNTWLYAYTKEVCQKIMHHMNVYDIGEAMRQILPYLDSLSTWYIRRSKDILKTHGSEVATCLVHSLKNFSITAASLQPFNTEIIWSIVRSEDDKLSVHLTDLPIIEAISAKEHTILEEMKIVRDLVSQIHNQRKVLGHRVRQPLYTDTTKLEMKGELKEILLQECNLIEKDLSTIEGQKWEQEGEFGSIILDTILDENLETLGYARDFERLIQDWRKKKGFQPGTTVTIKIYVEEVRSDKTLARVISNMNWEKLRSNLIWIEEKEENSDLIHGKNFIKAWVSQG